MKQLSIGGDSTLKNYLKMVKILLGDDSPAVTYLQEKIDKEGENAEVLADESQMVNVLMQIHNQN